MLKHRTVAAGKGVNAARAAMVLGSPTAAYGLIGSNDESRFSRLLKSDQVAARFVPICEVTRHNLTIVPTDGNRAAVHFRAPGYEAAPKDALDKLIALLLEELRHDDVIVLSGSSPGSGLQAWLEIGRALGEARVSTILDIYGAGAYVTSASLSDLRTGAERLLGNVDIRPLPAGEQIEHRWS